MRSVYDFLECLRQLSYTKESSILIWPWRFCSKKRGSYISMLMVAAGRDV